MYLPFAIIGTFDDIFFLCQNFAVVRHHVCERTYVPYLHTKLMSSFNRTISDHSRMLKAQDFVNKYISSYTTSTQSYRDKGK